MDSYLEIGVHPQKVSFINNGIAIPNKISEKKEVNGKITIVSVGRLTHQKNPNLFFKIASLLNAKYKKLNFIWIGDGEKKIIFPEYLQYVEITGWLDKNTLNNKLQEASIYLSSALWEGLPFAVLEAMSNKMPLILSNCIGNKDLVEDNVNGYLYKNEYEAIEAIEKYLMNLSLIPQHGERSYNKLKDSFDVKNMASAYEGIYKKIRIQ